MPQNYPDKKRPKTARDNSSPKTAPTALPLPKFMLVLQVAVLNAPSARGLDIHPLAIEFGLRPDGATYVLKRKRLLKEKSPPDCGQRVRVLKY